MNTFKVGDTKVEDWWKERCKPTMKPWLDDLDVRKEVQGITLHASTTRTVGGQSPLFDALSYAFNNHCPLVITPDAAWLTILTGLVHHIDANAKELRHHFVAHENKVPLEVWFESPGGIHTISAATWEDAIQGGPGITSKSFAEQLRERINPKRYEMIVCDFSTTTVTDRLASQIALMGAMKHWFEYKMMKLCGLSTVTVEGTPADWADIIARVRALEELDLGWWASSLVPVLEQVKRSCEGRPDIEFWKAAYLEHKKGSGGEYDVSGWINAFYPYVAGLQANNMRRNPFVDWRAGNKGLDSKDFPFGLVMAPVTVDMDGTIHKCEFYGGLVGVSMAEDFTVRAESGFAMQLI